VIYLTQIVQSSKKALANLGKAGLQRIDAICPGFASDGLETSPSKGKQLS